MNRIRPTTSYLRAAKTLSGLSKVAFIESETEVLPASLGALGAASLLGAPVGVPIGAALVDFGMAPEGLGASRALNSLAGGSLGSLLALELSPYIPKQYRTAAVIGSGIGGAYLGREQGKSKDPALMRLSRALGIEDVLY
jgi:hypothetical protein